VKFLARCAASIAKNGTNYVLLKFEHGHLIGQLAKALGELEPDATYEITIRKVNG
jgi:hypothetical protein